MEERCSNQPILQTKELTKYFKTSRGLLHAVDHVNLSISANKTLGVVGESGCGKSTLGRTILKLIEPFEANGTLVKRGRELLEREIEYFSVIEHDGVIFGCAALYPFPAEKMAEMACLIVDPEVQGEGDGERILNHMEDRARSLGFDKLFILTTQTAHWFLHRGFEYASVEELPKDRQRMYNWQRKSQVLIKKL